MFLAGMGASELSALLANYKFEQCTEFTITNADLLSAEIGKVLKLGFAGSAREEFRQTSGLAAPIRDANSKTIAALSIWNVGGSDLVDTLSLHLEAVRGAAASIQTSFGQID